MKNILILILIVSSKLCSGQTTQFVSFRSEFMTKENNFSKVNLSPSRHSRSYASSVAFFTIGTILVLAPMASDLFTDYSLNSDGYGVIALGGFFQIAGGLLWYRAYRYNSHIRRLEKSKQITF